MNKLVLATSNQGKIRELKVVAAGLPFEIKTLADYGLKPEIVEDGQSFFENAYKKASIVSRLTGESALADDSGLEVDILAGAPGIHSSCYAGQGATDEQNILKLLTALKGVPNHDRGARFVCSLVITQPDGSYRSFEGLWHGFITEEPRGKNGFGYDPVFFIPPLKMTAAELPAAVKNVWSHRAAAMKKLNDYFNNTFAQTGA